MSIIQKSARGWTRFQQLRFGNESVNSERERSFLPTCRFMEVDSDVSNLTFLSLLLPYSSLCVS